MIEIAVCIAALIVPGDIPAGCVNANELPLLVTWYDPARGGINCDADCGVLADGLAWSEMDYGRVAACIPEWHYRTITTPAGSWLCRDTGGGIVVENHPQFGPVVRVDVLQAGPFSWGDIYYVEEWQ